MSTPVKADDAEAAGDDKPCPQPTIAEAYFFLNIIKFQKNKLDVEWDKVAEESGFKNAETAKVCIIFVSSDILSKMTSLTYIYLGSLRTDQEEARLQQRHSERRQSPSSEAGRRQRRGQQCPSREETSQDARQAPRQESCRCRCRCRCHQQRPDLEPYRGRGREPSRSEVG
jgi:hypothetical protein